MSKFKTILIIITIAITFADASAKKVKVDEIQIAQDGINQAYKLGYVDAAPLEVAAIEKKVITARQARDTGKKKTFIKLIEEIKVDLTIVKKRYQANVLYKKLQKLQQENLESKKMLDDLKGQL